MSKPPRARTEVAQDLHSAALRLLRRLRTSDEALGVSTARLSALSVLVFAGPRTVTELARDEQVSQPTMTKLVAALARDGFVERAEHPTDRRATIVTATDVGRALLHEGRRQRVERLASMLGPLSDADVAALDRAAGLIFAALDRETHTG